MIKRLADLRAVGGIKPAGFVEEVLAGSVVNEAAGTYDIPEAHWAAMREKYAAKRPMRGLGDLVARVTSAVGIKPCGGCKGRQDTLNKIVPFSAGNSPSDH